MYRDATWSVITISQTCSNFPMWDVSFYLLGNKDHSPYYSVVYFSTWFYVTFWCYFRFVYGFYEACIGYFGIRDIGLFVRDTGIFVCFLFWDMGYSGILGYGILKFILGYELN